MQSPLHGARHVPGAKHVVPLPQTLLSRGGERWEKSLLNQENVHSPLRENLGHETVSCCKVLRA